MLLKGNKELEQCHPLSLVANPACWGRGRGRVAGTDREIILCIPLQVGRSVVRSRWRRRRITRMYRHVVWCKEHSVHPSRSHHSSIWCGKWQKPWEEHAPPSCAEMTENNPGSSWSMGEVRQIDLEPRRLLHAFSIGHTLGRAGEC